MTYFLAVLSIAFVKAAGRGEGELRRMLRTRRRIRHVAEAASPRIGAAWVPNTPNADHVRPETGARCGKGSARGAAGNSRPYHDHSQDRILQCTEQHSGVTQPRDFPRPSRDGRPPAQSKPIFS